jgi:hypothetical protein
MSNCPFRVFPYYSILLYRPNKKQSFTGSYFDSLLSKTLPEEIPQSQHAEAYNWNCTPLRILSARASSNGYV